MNVTIQYQESRKPHRWVNAFTARVLFADKKIILVRGCGTESTFHGDGRANSFGYRAAHPHAAKIPARSYFFRLHPASVARLAKKRA